MLAWRHYTQHWRLPRRTVCRSKMVEDLKAVGTALLRVFYETVYQDPPVVAGVEVPFAIEHQ